ncbi:MULTISPECIES: hypothetical protein [Methylobacterium]|uniref:hypothetical protein n=1 Tax=Methylobacterium TaxID=407 RepID=UPI001F3DFB76|nr:MULTISPECIES: hypothetical protein [Methylobacterium]MCF4124956.1 hypothetical protein [Methylobacterium sp. SyP6R]
MARRANRHVNPGDFIDRASHDAAVLHAGGPSPNHAYSFTGNSYESRLLAGVYGRSPEELYEADIKNINSQQERRPSCFVRKLRGRAVKPFYVDLVGPRPSLIGAQEFASHYAAAEFAVENNLLCDVSITIQWGLLGCHDTNAVKAGFRAFQMCLDAWLKDYEIPRAYFYVHEAGADGSLHTHLQVHIPADAEEQPTHRKNFREWAQRTWVQNRLRSYVPKAVAVSRGGKSSLMRHWMGFHYQMKGYDQDACIVRSRNSEDRQAVMLGDLIAFKWRNPGTVPLKKRIGHSELLGETSRRSGSPGGQKALKLAAESDQERRTIYIGDLKCILPPSNWNPENEPFQSSFEAGRFDVWRLYGAEFAAYVTRQSPPMSYAEIREARRVLAREQTIEDYRRFKLINQLED